MIEFKTGNIFDSKMQYITIPVNCGGIAGAGLSEQTKKLYPAVNNEYIKICKSNALMIGHPVSIIASKRYFLYFPTKKHWSNDSKIEYVEQGLENFWKTQKLCPNVFSIAFPALGCGFGALKWEDVKPIMIDYLSRIEIPIEIYEPCPEREMADKRYLKKVDRVSG